jgi:hypothetical protein
MNPTDKTPLAIEPDSGIRLNLSNYYRIRTWQGGGEFWEHNNQQLIRDALGQFLPRATVESGNFVLFQHYEGGKEICSLSQPVTAANPLPRSQLEELRAALTAFKAKTQDPKCDPEARKLIDCFRLPDPKKDAELYRIYGSGKNKRLIVLWGAEKEVDSAVPPLEAINRVYTEAVGAEKGSGKAMLVFGLLALLAALAWFLWPTDGKRDRVTGGGDNSATGKTTGEDADGTGGGTAATPIPAGEGPNGQDPGIKDPATGGSGSRAEDPSGIVSADGSSNHPGVPNKPSDTADTSISDQSGLGETAKSGDVTEPGADGGSTPDQVPTDNGPNATAPDDKNSIAKGDGAPKDPTPTGIDPSGQKDPVETPLAEVEADEPTAGTDRAETTDAKIDPKNALADMPDKSGNPGEGGSDTPSSESTTKTELTETKTSIEKSGLLVPSSPLSDPSAQSAIPTPGGLEIIKAEVGGDPRDGKVEVMLGLRALDSSQKEIQMNEATWFVDGEELKTPDGKPLSDPTIRRLLPVGKHTVSVVGRTNEGKVLRGRAQLDVRIKQKPMPEVDIQNSPTSKDK